MKTVKEVSRITGASIRTLHHYDAIGLLKPAKVTEAGYRLYDQAAIEKLQMILLFREIGFSLKEIGEIMDAPDADRNRALERQIQSLQKKRDHLDALITFANGVKVVGKEYLSMEHMELDRLEQDCAQAKILWGKTEAWKEFEEKRNGRSDEEETALGEQVMALFTELGTMRGLAPEHESVQDWVKRLQAFFTRHFYRCTPEILRGLGKMYAGGGSMTENIDAAGGPGTALLAGRAIEKYCE